MHRFTAAGPFTVGLEVVLDPTQSHHLARVLRLDVGDRIGLIDGRGGFASAVLQEIHSKIARAKIDECHRSESRSRLSLCFGAPKGQALDFIFRRATELGLESLQPLQTRFSFPLKGWNADRWESVVAEVCKQCEELYFPQVHPPRSLVDWIRQRDTTRGLVVCDENARDEKLVSLGDEPIDLVVGAEGGLSKEEVQALVDAGAVRLGLGRNRLRAETAALVAMVLIKKQVGEIGSH